MRILMYVLVGAAVLLHFVGALIPQIFGGRGASFDTASDTARTVVWIACIVNVMVHFAIIALALLNAVEPEELFFAVMISATAAMVAMGIRKKYRD